LTTDNHARGDARKDVDEMKPCPFCASNKLSTERWVVGSETRAPHTEYAVVCQNCGAMGPNDLGWSGAEESWNMRRTEFPAPAAEERPQ
jgi:galactose-1-phosphate uridylyltransferase